MDLIYKYIGQILRNAQCIEWNLAAIICRSQSEDEYDIDALFDKMQNMTLGQIIDRAKKIDLLNEDDLDDIEYILGKRNYLVHQFFKKNDFNKHIGNADFMKNKENELHNLLVKFQNFNERLVAILGD